jgi:two-component system, chemotaxis family, protein-glutamate methylesterase/glutaminase
MRALPENFRNIQGDQVTGLSCPSCPGVLAVRVEEAGDSFLHFRCRIGHTFSTEELLTAKERGFEDHLWNATTALDELAHLISDLLSDPPSELAVATNLGARRERARQQIASIRQLIEQNRPIELKCDPIGLSDTDGDSQG